MADSKLSALRSTSPFVAPLADTDLLYMVQDVSTTPDERAIAASELKAQLKAYNDTLYAAIGAGAGDGWTAGTGTWAYASATTITVPSGAAAIYSVGDKIKLTANSVVLYAYIVTVADTLLTVKGDALTNHTFTANYYSKQTSPLNFPQWFAYTPTGIAGSNVTLTGRFCLVGRTCYVAFKCAFTGAITYTTDPTLPITAGAGVTNDAYNVRGVGGYYENGGTNNIAGLSPTVITNGTTFGLRTAAGVALSASAPITWANGDELYANFWYEV